MQEYGRMFFGRHGDAGVNDNGRLLFQLCFKQVLLNFFRFPSPLPSIAASPFTALRMHVPCDSNK